MAFASLYVLMPMTAPAGRQSGVRVQEAGAGATNLDPRGS
jgi:hypothetical protein